jgi:hypothetical protein
MYLLIFFLAVGRYIAISRKPLHCAGAFTAIAFLCQIVQQGFLAALVYTLIVGPVTFLTYILLDRFEDQLVQWFGVAILGGCLITFGPGLATAKLRARPGTAVAAKQLTYSGKAFQFSYPETWILQERGKNVSLRCERGQAAATLLVMPEGKVKTNQAIKQELERRQTVLNDTTALGGLAGYSVKGLGRVQGAVLEHHYIYALTTDTLRIDTVVDTERRTGPDARALVQEAEAIEASWKWKPSAL